jgi:hypothetical protein
MDIHQARKRVLSLPVKIWGAFILGILGFRAISAAVGCVNRSYKALKNCSALSSSSPSSCHLGSFPLLRRLSGILLPGSSSDEEESEGSEGGGATLRLGRPPPLPPFPTVLPKSVPFWEGGNAVLIAALKVRGDGGRRLGSCIASVSDWASIGCLLAIQSTTVWITLSMSSFFSCSHAASYSSCCRCCHSSALASARICLSHFLYPSSFSEAQFSTFLFQFSCWVANPSRTSLMIQTPVVSLCAASSFASCLC